MLEKGYRQYIRELEIIKDADSINEYPFNLNAISKLNKLEFHPNVTYIIGENGSGKSTLLEAVAVAYGFNAEGGSKSFNFSTFDSHSKLSDSIRLTKGIQAAKDGYFFRAESFYNVSSNIEELDSDFSFSPPVINSYGGKSLHKQSHGESFMSLILHRFGGKGIYILDEPESALSPTRQLALLSRMHDLILDDSQFIIATHSPIIMAYPEAVIYNIEEDYKEITYKETKHYQTMRDFINNSDRMLELLMSE